MGFNSGFKGLIKRLCASKHWLALAFEERVFFFFLSFFF